MDNRELFLFINTLVDNTIDHAIRNFSADTETRAYVYRSIADYLNQLADAMGTDF